MTEEFLDLEIIEEEGEIVEANSLVAAPLTPIIREDDLEGEPLIIRYGMTEYRKKRLEMNKQDEPEDLLNGEQKKYLTLLSEGLSNQEACAELGLDRIVPTIWAKMRGNDSIYGICLQAIKEMQADDLEDEVWKEAIGNPRNSDLKKFALKARKEEYKDNVQQQTNIQTNIRVTLDGVPYSVDTDCEDSYA
ncbi:MAG: hypothetical protein PHG61_01880 [Candidatus Marinimicrobia bacterium]|nr:hypothetical protein [Candidatus Neomarinimicrobiota bacterium]